MVSRAGVSEVLRERVLPSRRSAHSAQYALVECLGARPGPQIALVLLSSSVLAFLLATEHLDAIAKATVQSQ